MGTDIHTRAEILEDGEWIVPIDRVFYDFYENDYSRHPYGERCYDFFAILADVRNGYGTAFCDTGDPVGPLAPYRGIPDDCQYREDWGNPDHIWLGDHSFSWVSLADMLEFKSRVSGTRAKRGVVSEQEFMRLKSSGLDRPDHGYCGWVSGSDIVVFTEEDYLGADDHPRDKKIYVQIEWEEPLLGDSFVGKYYDSWVNGMTELAKLHALADDEVRIVFGFDS